MNQIKLGMMLRDLTTGFEGIATNKTVLLNGCIQYGIQPPVKDGVYPESISIDENLLEIISEGVSAKATPTTLEQPIELGNKVMCLVTRIEGFAITRSYCLNGCVLYQIEHKGDGKDKDINFTTWIDQCRLSVTGVGIANTLKLQPKDAQGKTPGGPVMRNVPRF